MILLQFFCEGLMAKPKKILKKGIYSLKFKYARKIKNRDDLDAVLFLFKEQTTNETIQRTIILNNEAQSNLSLFIKKLSDNQESITNDSELTILEKINKYRENDYKAIIEPNKTQTYNNITAIMAIKGGQYEN